MKKVLFVLTAFFSLAMAASAQGGGGFPRRTAEERAAAIHQKLDSAFKLDAATGELVGNMAVDLPPVEAIKPDW